MIKKFLAVTLVVFSVFTFNACALNYDPLNSSIVDSETTSIQNSLETTSSSTKTSDSETKDSTKKSETTSVSSDSGSTSSTTSSSEQNGELTTAQKKLIEQATNVIDWQLDNGGWGKNYDTTAKFTSYPSDYSWTVNGKFVGTIDNKATHTEMRILANAYNINQDKKFKDSFDKGMKFLQNLQYESGGFSQIYPHNGKYNDYVTFNDEAMTSVIVFLQEIANNDTKFTKITNQATRTKCAQMVEKAIDYILKSQIVIDGVKTAWCAQHDPVNYKPMKARDYELPSVSGSESVGIIKFLLAQKNNPEAVSAGESARLWLKSKRLENTSYSKSACPNSFTTKEGSYCWYRFYDIETGKGFFCTRKSGKANKKYFDFAEFCAADFAESGNKYDRANGYDWAGNWLERAGLNY